VDLDTGAIIAADQGDTVSLRVTLEAAMEQLAALHAAPVPGAGGADRWASKIAADRPAPHSFCRRHEYRWRW
jgi:hypothetical protein